MTDVLKKNGSHSDVSSIADAPDHNSVDSSRRRFLRKAGGSTVAIAAASILSVPALEEDAKGQLLGDAFSTIEAILRAIADTNRADRAAKIRIEAAIRERRVPIPSHPDNGDEARFPNRIGNFSKNLRHDPGTGEVDPAAYNAFLDAIDNGRQQDFEALEANGFFGCGDSSRQRRLVDPQAGLAFDLEGTDSHQLAQVPAPAFSSAEEAGEMAELYWMALLRDVNFTDYATNPIAQRAAADLSRLSVFRGPKTGGQVTPQTLFRDKFPGCTVGPYISQFLLQAAKFGAQRVDQRIETAAPNVDFNTTFSEWLDTQDGCAPTRSLTLDGLVFCRNGRDLGQYVHVDVLFQAYFVALLVLLSGGYLLDSGNPYGPIPDGGAGLPLPGGATGTRGEVGFGTFGGPHIATLVCEPATRALKAVWFQKWFVHRRLRPEEFGGRVEVQRLGRATYPFHPDLFNSSVLGEVISSFGSYLLPTAFPEGSPNHPSYGAGHATVAAACVTMLKAFFDESAVVRNPVVPSADGQNLDPFVGPSLTVGGELNKLASNVATGRNIAGVHWRSDGVESIKLGEQVAISILSDMRETYNQPFNGFRLTKFDGTTITI